MPCKAMAHSTKSLNLMGTAGGLLEDQGGGFGGLLPLSELELLPDELGGPLGFQILLEVLSPSEESVLSKGLLDSRGNSPDTK